MTQSEFSQEFDSQIGKISEFLKAWSKYRLLKSDQLTCQMTTMLIASFVRDQHPTVLDLSQLADSTSEAVVKLDSESDYLMNNLMAVQRCLKEIFFD